MTVRVASVASSTWASKDGFDHVAAFVSFVVLCQAWDNPLNERLRATIDLRMRSDAKIS